MPERGTEPLFKCPRCGMVSHHPDDVREGYCGACHDWTGDPARRAMLREVADDE